MPQKDNVAEAPIKLFKTASGWSTWLEKNHRKSKGLWLRLAKKKSLQQSVSYMEALDVALSYGWIDGRRKSESEHAWLQKFLPRAKRSLWSKVNRLKVLSLIERGEMKEAGLEAIEDAKKNGQWEAAYDSPSTATVPADFQSALDKNPQAGGFFETLDRRNRYSILWRIQTVKKAETRVRKIGQLIEMLERGEKIHP